MGKSNPYLSRKIYHPCCRHSVLILSKRCEECILPNRGKNKKTKDHWPLHVFLIAILMSAAMSFCSATVLQGSGLAITVVVLVVFILLGIAFDMIGIAVTAADPRPFHSMAAHKEKGGREAIKLLNKASKVSSFCNDVVGDICGIVSGSTAAVIVTTLQNNFNTQSVLISIGVTALISGLTIGGKALCKQIAIEDSTKVVYRVARILHTLHMFR